MFPYLIWHIYAILVGFWSTEAEIWRNMYEPKKWPWCHDVRGTWFQTGFGSVHVVKVRSQALSRINITGWCLQRQAAPNWGKGHADKLAPPVSLDNASLIFHDDRKMNWEQILKCTFRKWDDKIYMKHYQNALLRVKLGMLPCLCLSPWKQYRFLSFFVSDWPSLLNLRGAIRIGPSVLAEEICFHSPPQKSTVDPHTQGQLHSVSNSPY